MQGPRLPPLSPLSSVTEEEHEILLPFPFSEVQEESGRLRISLPLPSPLPFPFFELAVTASSRPLYVLLPLLVLRRPVPPPFLSRYRRIR